MEQERIEKQQYLRDQIIGQHLNPTEFQQFMEQQKKGGSNIDNWSLSQLEHIVQLFRNSIQSAKVTRSIKLQPNLNIIADLGDCEYQITFIEQNQQKSRLGLFTTNDTDQYQIITKPYNWKVTRTFRDFKQMVVYLKQNYPGFYIPVLPKKLQAKKQFSLKKKIFKLEYFCKNLKKFPELFFNPIVVQFFRNPDSSQFEQQIKLQMKNKISNYQQIQLLDNEKTIETSKQKQDYIDQSSNQLENFSNIYKVIKENLKQLIVDLNQTQNTVQALQNNFAMMFQIENDFNSKICGPQEEGIKEIYVRINNLMENIYSQNQKNIEAIYTKVNSFMNFQMKEAQSIQEMIRNYNVIQQEYKRQSAKERNDKVVTSFNDLEGKFVFYQHNTYSTLKEYTQLKIYNYHNLVFEWLLDLKTQNQEQNSQFDEFIKHISSTK